MKTLNKWLIVCIIVSFIILFFIIKPYYIFLNRSLKISLFKTLFSYRSLETYNGEVNLLFLGIAGGTHEGPNLSDSIMVANYNLKTNKLTTISIPRDIWSETLEDKINSAYAYGEAKKSGGGFILAKAEISSIVDLPIQYVVVIDFDRFRELIDFLGGVEIDVENSFVDKKFPIPGKENDSCQGDKEYQCRYETISFKKGKILMNGEIALKFVRSRYADGREGTDFAREKRQQKVIEAVKNKLISLVKKPDIKQYEELYKLLNDLVKRDINNQQAAIIIKDFILAKNLHQEEIVLSDDFFVNPGISSQYEYMWVLIPKNNDIKKVHQYIRCRLDNNKECKKD